MYSDLATSLTGFKSSSMTDDLWLGKPRKHIKGFNWILEAMGDEHCDTALYMPEFHLMDKVFDDPERFRCLEVWHTWPCDWFSAYRNQKFSTTSQLQSSGMEKPVGCMNTKRTVGPKGTHGMRNLEHSSKSEKNSNRIDSISPRSKWGENCT